ncbi:MAG TPA: Rrf2 family transcriptional regulator [Anaerolineae bacterium]|nr:Rrf2 family transcriptional regulator [Anaerolineae bacterium]
MRISTRGAYGLRAMIELAQRYGQGPVPLAEVAQTEGISLSYLEQIIAPLRKAGLVESKRGAYGGYALARDPSTITVGQIVRALEGPITPYPCASEGEDFTCEREASCTARLLWQRMRDSIAAVLDSTTLEELVPQTRGSE